MQSHDRVVYFCLAALHHPASCSQQPSSRAFGCRLASTETQAFSFSLVAYGLALRCHILADSQASLGPCLLTKWTHTPAMYGTRYDAAGVLDTPMLAPLPCSLAAAEPPSFARSDPIASCALFSDYWDSQYSLFPISHGTERYFVRIFFNT